MTLRTSSSLRRTNSDRFGQPISDEALDEAIVKSVHYKTWKTTDWVVSVFRFWSVARAIVKDITELGVDQLVDLLPCFVITPNILAKLPVQMNYSTQR